jgi:hypothetical protein
LFLSEGTATRNVPALGFGPVSVEEIQQVVRTVLAMSCAPVSSIAPVMAEIEQLPAGPQAGEALHQHGTRLG